MPEVSVVIPCLDEARSIEICVKKALAALDRAGIDGEVVVADNGSSDDSPVIAEQAGARVVDAPLRGYGNALRAGIAAAEGVFIVIGDADDSYDFTDVPRFVDKWREGYDVVMGNRFAGEIKAGAMPWSHRYIGNPVLSGVSRLFFRTGIRDAHCGMRGFTKDVYERMSLQTTGMEFASEFVIKAAGLGASMTEIPVTLWPDRRGRPPHLRSVPDGWRHLRFMLLLSPTWLFLVPGIALATTGVAIVLWLLPSPRVVGSVQFDIHTMLFGMMFTLVGLQIATIGLFARVFAYNEGLAVRRPSRRAVLPRVTLEQGLMAGAALLALGIGGSLFETGRWATGGFGEFSGFRPVLFFALVVLVGVQVLFASFFLSMLGISRHEHLGNYDLKGTEPGPRDARG